MQSLEMRVRCGKTQFRRPDCSAAGRAVMTALALVALLMFANTAAAQNMWMHLLSPGVGWFGDPHELFWTTDNGQHWKDITPPGVDRTGYGSGSSIGSVFFLDTSTGWVVLNGWEQKKPNAEEKPDQEVPSKSIVELAFTQDSGTTWLITRPDFHLNLSGGLEGYSLDGAGDIQFTDATHGWINVGVQRAESSFLGQLYRTVDGGKNWTWVSGALGASSLVRFIDRQNGWIASTDAKMDSELWATHDGAESWNQVKLAPPAGVGPAFQTVYQLPVFRDNKHGVLAVSYDSSPSSDEQWAVLFATADGGKTWKFSRVLAHGSGVGAGAAVRDAIIMIGSVAIMACDENLTLAKMPLDRKHATRDCTELQWGTQLSFIDENQGWALTMGAPVQLLSTVDGGGSWAEISPWKREEKRPPAQPATPAPPPLGVPPGLRPLAADGLRMDLGFDKCEILGEDEMGILWSGWYYQGTGVYIGGITHGCQEPDSSWITAVEGEGWGIIPTLGGPQQGDRVSGLNDNAALAGWTSSGQNCVDGLILYSGLQP
jgi:photosystem II stability/assembly factor-like uncharacterized protein